MAMKLWASSTANALKLSSTNRTGTIPSLTFSISRCFSSVLDGLKYSSSHEWIRHEGSVATIGITDHAQGHLGEVVFVELPESGGTVRKGSGFGAVESVKATSDVNSPISGQVVEVNAKLTETPGLKLKPPLPTTAGHRRRRPPPPATAAGPTVLCHGAPPAPPPSTANLPASATLRC